MRFGHQGLVDNALRAMILMIFLLMIAFATNLIGGKKTYTIATAPGCAEQIAVGSVVRSIAADDGGVYDLPPGLYMVGGFLEKGDGVHVRFEDCHSNYPVFVNLKRLEVKRRAYRLEVLNPLSTEYKTAVEQHQLIWRPTAEVAKSGN